MSKHDVEHLNCVGFFVVQSRNNDYETTELNSLNNKIWCKRLRGVEIVCLKSEMERTAIHVGRNEKESEFIRNRGNVLVLVEKNKLTKRRTFIFNLNKKLIKRIHHANEDASERQMSHQI